MSIRTKLTAGEGVRPKPLDGTGASTPAQTVEKQSPVVEKEVGARPDQMATNGGAAAALRALAMQTKTPEKPMNKGAQSATLGAKLMSFARSENGKKAAAIMSFGASMMGMAQNAQADVIHVGSAQGTQVQQAAQKIAAETGQPYVQVTADKSALEQVFEKAEKGELKLTHLILDADGSNKLPNQYEWQSLAQKYPKAAAQVEQVHVLGHDLAQHPFQSWQGQVFPNAKAVVSFDLSTAMEQGPASAWLLEATSKSVAGMPAGLSAQDAQIQAKTIASQGAQMGVRTRVDVGTTTHTQNLENPLSQWLDTMAQGNTNISRAQLEGKLKEFAASPEGLTDGMLGSLASKIQTRGFKMDYDASRLASHVVDIRRAAGAETAVKALVDGNVHQVRHDLAVKENTTQYAQERSSVFSGEVTRGVPLSGSAAIPTGGVQGKAYLVDGLGTVRNGEVTIQAIRHPTNGDGYQLTFKLGDGAGHRLESFMSNRGASLIDKTIVNQAPKDGRVVTVEKTDAVQASATQENQQPEMSIGPALRLEKAGEYRLDYFPESISKQSLRTEVHLQVYGATDAERNEQLQKVLQQLNLDDVMTGKPSADTEEKMKALRLLEQADPRAAHAMSDRIDRGEKVTLQDLHNALIAAEVPPAFLQQAYFAEASPGHLSVIVPGQSEAYGRRGVHALYHTMGSAQTFAFIAADGALMSTKDRLQVGKVFRGMSSDEDLRSGGADYLFTRQVTSGTGNPNAYEMRGGAIIMKSDVLDRADWFAYSGDRYGTTLAGDRGEATPAVKEAAKRTYDALVEKKDAAVEGRDFDTWFKGIVQAQIDHREDTYLPRPVGRHQVKETTGTSNETMLEGTIPMSQWERFIVKTQEDKDKVIAKLKELGVNDINGQKLEDFIQVRDKNFFTDEEMLKMQNPVDVKPGDKVADPRLQFYVNNTVKTPGIPGETKIV